jgi:DNA-binding transcriptional LysR family regulator
MPKSGIIRAGRLLELEAVAAVAERKNFRRAAQDLGLSTTTLSRTVAAVEERLGLQLFARTTRSVSLTSAGQRFVARVTPALREIGGAIDDIVDERDTPRGTLRINCSSGAARQILQGLIIPFLDQHPGISLDLTTESRLIDIVADGFDAGIRQASSVPAEMPCVRISEAMAFVVVGSPGYLSGRALPSHPAKLKDHRCIRIRLSNGKLYEWEFRHPAGGELRIDAPGALTLDDPALMRLAALANGGLAYLERSRVAEDIQAGRLVRMLEDWAVEEEPLYLYHPSRHPSAALRALIDSIGLA